MITRRIVFYACLLGYVDTLFGNKLCLERTTDGCPSRNCEVILPEEVEICSFWCHSIRNIPKDCPKDSTSIHVEACCVETIEPEKLSRYRELNSLVLTCNFISTLTANVFANNSDLTSINLSNNRLTSIDAQAFHGLHKLETLNLMRNQLETLPRGVFASLTSLRTLHLDRNLFQVFDIGWFTSKVGLRVQCLSLSHNQISNIVGDPGVLKSVEILDLTGNKLTTWDARPQLQDLRSLDLSGNQISSISKGAFPNHNLRDINLSENLITWLDPELFEDLRFLQKLALKNNRFTVAHPQWFKYIVTNNKVHPVKNTYYNLNRWKCDDQSNCVMQSYLKKTSTGVWAQSDVPLREVINISCYTPVSLRGKNLMDVNLSDCATYEELVKPRIAPQNHRAMYSLLLPIGLCFIIFAFFYAFARRRKQRKRPASESQSAEESSSLGDVEQPESDLGKISDDSRNEEAESTAYFNVGQDGLLPCHQGPPLPPRDPPYEEVQNESQYFNIDLRTISYY